MTTASDWQDPIFGLEQREPVRGRELALVVLSAVVVMGCVGVALSTPQTQDATVLRPATFSLPPAIPALVPLELELTAPALKKAPVERKTRPARDVLGERL